METAQRKLWMKQWEGLRKGRAQMGEGETQTGRGSGSVGGAQRARRGSAACMRGGLSELVRHQQDWAPWRAHLDGDGIKYLWLY